MKLHILSDLHLSCGPLELPANDADAVIAAGDIARPKEAVAWLLGVRKPVLYVPGNHEFLWRQHRRHPRGTEAATYPDDESYQVSHETIYRSLFIQARGALKKELLEHLRRYSIT